MTWRCRSVWAVQWRCIGTIAAKLIVKRELTKHRRQIDVFFVCFFVVVFVFFTVRQGGCVRVLQLIMIVLFSSVSLWWAPSGREESATSEGFSVEGVAM